MAVYRPTYRDPKTGELKQSQVLVVPLQLRRPSHSGVQQVHWKTIALGAEKRRRSELEKCFNNIEDSRHERIKTVAEIAESFFEEYKLRNPRSATFAEYAVRHIIRIVGQIMVVDISDRTVRAYQTYRLKESAAPNAARNAWSFIASACVISCATFSHAIRYGRLASKCVVPVPCCRNTSTNGMNGKGGTGREPYVSY
jgi:hypothetical protein